MSDLFQLTKLEAHELKAAREPFALTELAQDVLQKFELAANKRRLVLEARIAPEVPHVTPTSG